MSLDVPLISNQDVYLNIALIKKYHENMKGPKAHELAFDALERLDLLPIAYKRNPALTSEERFCVMLLRATMVRNAAILIDRPYRIIPHLANSDFIFSALNKVEQYFSLCHIYDFAWVKDEYGVP